MKNFRLVLMVLALGISSAAFAEDTATIGNAEAVETAEAANHGYCSAVTTCYNPYYPPYTIQCQVYGRGCTWWTVPYQSVQCTGLDYYGRWVNLFYRCY